MISPVVLRHIFDKHRDLVRKLGLRDLEELADGLRRIVEDADEVYVDAFGVEYYVKRVDELYAAVIVVDGMVKTAYLLSGRTRNRMRGRRWIRRLR